MEHHCHHDQEHTESHSHDEHRVQLAKEGQCGHMVNGPYPQGGYHVFESEDTAEHESEYGGKYSRCGNDPGKRGFLKVVDQGAADQEEEPLPHIPEHDTEDEGVGQADENSRVHFIMCGKPVHLHKHLKGFEDLRVFQLCGRFPEVCVVVVLHDDKYFVVVFDFFHEFLYVVFRHPAAEDVILFLVVLHAGRQLADVEIIGELFQAVPGRHQLRRAVREHLSRLFVQVVDLKVHPGDLPLQRLVGIGRRPFELVL